MLKVRINSDATQLGMSGSYVWYSRPRLRIGPPSLGASASGGGIRRASFFKTSLLYTMENGATAEMGLTGNDGVVGIALFMGGGTMPNRAVVQSAGDAIRMKAKVLQNEFAFEW